MITQSFINTLYKSKRKVILIIILTMAIFTILAVILPEYYRSTTILLPDVEKSKVSTSSSLLNFSTEAGINILGELTWSKLYPTIIQSEVILKNVIYRKYKSTLFSDSVNLVQFWKINEKTPERAYEEALKIIRNELEIKYDIKLGTVTVSILTRDPNVSADILNAIVEELNSFLLTNRISNASMKRKWIEARLSEVKKDLEESENNLKLFREKNRIITGSPQLMLEHERLIREVQINTAVYTELKKQHEIARIEEIKTIPIITVLDKARPAAKKEKPKRRDIVLMGLIFSLFAALSYTYIEYRYPTYIGTFKTFVNEVLKK